MRTIQLFLAGLVLLSIAAPAVHAQNFDRAAETIAEGTAYYTYVRPGEASIQVLVIGAGGGIYEVGADTRMDEFLALLGGAPSFATREVATRSRVSIQLYRMAGFERQLIYDRELEDLIATPEDNPALAEDDIFVVQTINRRRLNMLDAVTILSRTSTFLLLADRLGFINLGN